LKFKNLIKKKPFIIAEISANHNGSLKNAKKLIYTAKKCGADAVKLQTYTPQSLTINSRKKDFIIKEGIWRKNSLWELYKKASTPYSWHKHLFLYAKKINILIFSTPFDENAVDVLEKLKCPFYKVASFEMNHIPLIKKIAKTKKTLIISTGMASLKEIDLTYKIAKKYGSKDIILLYCVSNYPSKISDFNLNNIKILKKKYKCITGFSDHSNDNVIAETAVACGAEVIEKHIALSNQKNSLDFDFSLTENKFKKYVSNLKKINSILGKDFFFRNKSEKKSLKFRRSIYAIKDIKKNDILTKKNIKIIRPGYGIEPLYFEKILNKKSPINIKAETPLKKKILKSLKIKILN
tara:strand:- start:544 stop:1596 length:1053 start_codon:yes stop_codon:yes gene_type:complete